MARGIPPLCPAQGYCAAEICVHDSGTRVASLLYCYGPTNQIYIGRDKGWGTSSVFIGGYFSNVHCFQLIMLDLMMWVLLMLKV